MRIAVYETFGHTADVGLRITADDLNTLFDEAGQALTSLMIGNLQDVRPRIEKTFRIEADEAFDRAYLLVDWLNELLFAFESERMLFCRFTVAVDESGLTATAAGEPLDERRHRLDHEVKAITYHGLKVEPSDNGWTAEVIVDL